MIAMEMVPDLACRFGLAQKRARKIDCDLTRADKVTEPPGRNEFGDGDVEIGGRDMNCLLYTSRCV